MRHNILTVNAGSSSIKCALFKANDKKVQSTEPAWRAHVEFKSEGGAELTCQVPDKSKKEKRNISAGDRLEAISQVFDLLFSGQCKILDDPSEIEMVGHRVVHGGTKYLAGTIITGGVMDDLRKLVDLAPLHEQANIEGIKIAGNRFEAAKQVAVFDTSFHRTMPRPACIYPVPYGWYEDWQIQRFGFHGISHQYLSSRVGEMAISRATGQTSGKGADKTSSQGADKTSSQGADKTSSQAADKTGGKPSSGRIITCHIGNGASLCAIKDGRCLMTTMGYTPLDGLVMGTRSGSIDPGILLHLLRKKYFSIDQLDDLLNHQSGLKGISGISSDMREIERAMTEGNERASLAFEIYVDRLAANIAALVPRLGGLDVLVFAGGVGENSAALRSAACRSLDFLGVNIDPDKNEGCRGDSDISAAGAGVATLVIQTKEEFQIAIECLNFLP